MKQNRILDQKGQGLTEYITLLMLVAVLSIGTAAALGRTIKSKISVARKAISEGISIKNASKGSGSSALGSILGGGDEDGDE